MWLSDARVGFCFRVSENDGVQRNAFHMETVLVSQDDFDDGRLWLWGIVVEVLHIKAEQ